MGDETYEEVVTHAQVVSLIKFELKGLIPSARLEQVALDLANELFEDFTILPYYKVD